MISGPMPSPCATVMGVFLLIVGEWPSYQWGETKERKGTIALLTAWSHFRGNMARCTGMFVRPRNFLSRLARASARLQWATGCN
jgi:hypothetical protein